MTLYVARKSTETWRQCVERMAGQYGLQQDCLAIFDRRVAAGADEDQAAWEALGEWDCLDYREHP